MPIFIPFLGRHMIHSMAVIYAALVCTSVFQSSLLGISVPQIKTAWMNSASQPSVHQSSDFGGNEKPIKTLALLFPPGLLGGYRNQVMRFIGFLDYAKRHNISQLLLPTILFTTTYKKARDEKRFFPVPMASLFDIEHWNSFAGHLPVLVDAVDDGDCWELNLIDSKSSELGSSNQTPSAKVFTSPMAYEIIQTPAFLGPVKKLSHEILTGAVNVQTRKLDLLSQVEHCSNPIVYGGGKGAGRLWNDYLRIPKARPGESKPSVRALDSTELISYVSKALLPSKKWREIAHQCIRMNQQRDTKNEPSVLHKGFSPFLALHARVEVDMLVHRCSKDMEKNLTRIFDMVETFMEEMKDTYANSSSLEGIFVAVSRRGMLHPTKDESVQEVLVDNWRALISRDRRASNIFECGEEMMSQWYSAQPHLEDDYYGSVLASVLNFYIATQASIFIGVSKSSWSTDVWTARYYQGMGSGNFEYTQDGIVPIPNGGLPSPHGNC